MSTEAAPATTTAAHESATTTTAPAASTAPATNGTAHTTNGTAHPEKIDTSVPAGSSPPTAASASKSPGQAKADLKNEQAYAKVLTQKSAAEGKELKGAIKDGQVATKTDAKAASQELKAKKGLDKAIKKEYRLNKKLVDIKAKYDAAVTDLEKAKARLELKQSHHETTTALRDEKLKAIDELKARSTAV